MDIFVEPNWKDNVKDTFEFLTTVFTSDNGKEQRMAERKHARRTTAFTALIHGDELRNLRADLRRRSDTLTHIPDPVRRIGTVAASTLAGQTSITFLVPVDISFVGKRVCLIGFKKHFFATIHSIVSNTVNFTSPISEAFSVGDIMYACIYGRFPESAKVNYATDDIAEFQVSFDQNPGENNSTYDTNLFPIWNGREIFTIKPNWANPPKIEILAAYDTIDYKRGVIDTYSPIDFASQITEFSFLGYSDAKMRQLVDFFNRQKGRQGEFWCPSWTSDFRVVQGVAAGATTLKVAGRKIADYYIGSTVEKAIGIMKSDGSWINCSVSGLSTDGITTTISLEAPILSSIDIPSIIGVYWLNVCRFAVDSMTVQWITDNVCQTVLQIKTLEVLIAE